MSQTTRCPACHTRFKVVADQLRISDGWVRCGHCKQVFDASISLEPAAPEPMLPEMPLDRLRGPVERAVGPLSEPRAWGSSASVGDGGASSRAVAHPLEISEPEDSEDLDDGFAVTQIGAFDPELAVPIPAVPEHVPAFLKTPLTREPDFLRPPVAQPLHDGGGLSRQEEPQGAAAKDKAQDVLNSPDGSRHRIDPTWQDPWRTSVRHPDGPAAGRAATQVGYELPGAQIEDTDSDWPALFEDMPAAPADLVTKAERKERGVDAAEPDLAHFIAEVAEWSTEQSGKAAPTPAVPSASAPPATVPPSSVATPAAASAVAAARSVAQEVRTVPTAPPLPSEAEPDQAPPDSEDPDWTLVQDDLLHEPLSAPAEVANPFKEQLSGQEGVPVTEPQELVESDLELSFVRHARRRAFWSGTGVRAGLLVTVLVLLLGLVAQIGLHERARLTAQWPQSRALWSFVCGYLQCTVGAYRDMGAVVVDGSSFNRVQGERYQFALTLRNRAALPVEAPAIELTLTDTEDQPVLRRILMPAELAVPDPLLPGAEWSAVIPMAIGSGAQRIAGYRVLAFYP
ncbi:MAG: zinc-ribbon domain-containing protein [Simplicispira suum]|nr:DUF3426 domain-containing protein [Simplicispira suum]MBW7832650.1 zinc-ribbon domain-containing protein [Simplicispira suum]